MRFSAKYVECALVASTLTPPRRQTCALERVPTTAVPAFEIGRRPRRIDGEPVGALWGAFPFAVPFNVGRTAAATLPCGLAAGLPVGLQLVAPPGGEGLLLDAGAQLEAELAFDRSPVTDRWVGAPA